jgi:nucleoside 2-deoxyribosyltransferase
VKRPTVRRPFPQNTLEEALAVSMAIKEKNRGNPFDTEDVAKACKLSPKGMAFFYLAASSRDYGLTEGSRETPTLSLTPLGNSIVYPESAQQQQQDKIKAFFNVPLFNGVNEHYGGGALPEKEFVSRILTKRFDLDESLHDDFCELYQKNCRYLSLTDGRDGFPLVGREGQGAGAAIVIRQPGQYSHRAFVIMPFSEKGENPRPDNFFEEVLTSLIKPACNAADFGVETAQCHGSDLIHRTIIGQLDEADLVIADLSDHNPNVLFELGVRIALDKPVLLIRAKGTPPIFDVDNMMRVCEYDPRLWKTTIDTDITTMTDYVKGAWENKDKNPSYMSFLKTEQASQQTVALATPVARESGRGAFNTALKSAHRRVWISFTWLPIREGRLERMASTLRERKIRDFRLILASFKPGSPVFARIRGRKQTVSTAKDAKKLVQRSLKPFIEGEDRRSCIRFNPSHQPGWIAVVDSKVFWGPYPIHEDSQSEDFLFHCYDAGSKEGKYWIEQLDMIWNGLETGTGKDREPCSHNYETERKYNKELPFPRPTMGQQASE